MNNIKKFISVLSCLLIVLSFAACGGKDNGETITDTPSQTEEATAKDKNHANNKADNKEDDGGDLLITLYMDCDSLDYQELTGKTEHISTGYEPRSTAEYFRFVSPKDGVTVRVEGIMWSPIVDDFEVTNTFLEIKTEKDKIYEFECYVTETIPDYRIVAEYGEMKATYYLAMDGYEVITKLLMVDEGFTPEEITEDSVFYNLCVARAVSDVFYSDRHMKYEPPVVWDTVAYALTLTEFKMNGTEDYKNMIGLSEWEADAYFKALYPTLNESDIPLPENESVVAAHFSTGKKYLVMPYTFERFSTNEFYGVDDNGDGTYSVKIRIDDYRYEGYEENGCAVIVRPDADSPFGYVIEDVADCDLPKG